MCITKLHAYPRVILLFDEGAYTEYTPENLVTLSELLECQMVLAFKEDGTTRILKNRWGKTT